jgi:nitrate reductase NapAB chaperone NapD
MKKIKILLAPIFALLLTTTLMAGVSPKKGSVDAKDALRNTIAQKIKSIDLENLNLKDKDVRVQFIINDKSEIIVLKTDNKELDGIVKATLNYNEIDSKDLSKNSLYAIKIKLVS